MMWDIQWAFQKGSYPGINRCLGLLLQRPFHPRCAPLLILHLFLRVACVRAVKYLNNIRLIPMDMAQNTYGMKPSGEHRTQLQQGRPRSNIPEQKGSTLIGEGGT